jgi:hypothetical protein
MRSFMWIVKILVSAPNWIIAIATVVYTYFALGQWHELQKTNNLSKDTLELNNRSLQLNRDSLLALQPAQVVYSGLTIARFAAFFEVDSRGARINKGPAMGISPIWTNIGNTRARKIRIYFGDPIKSITPIEHPDMAIPPETKFIPLVIGSKQSANGAFKPLTADELSQIRDGKIHLFIWGQATYFDVFPNTPEHITQFCQEAIGISGSNPSDVLENAGLVTQACLIHNCIDDDCKVQD